MGVGLRFILFQQFLNILPPDVTVNSIAVSCGQNGKGFDLCLYHVGKNFIGCIMYADNLLIL
jgi:hypothetical protein